MTSAENELRPGERVAWGPPPIAEPDRPKMRLLEWRSMVRNTLRGFCVIELPSGLVIRDVAVHEKAGKFGRICPLGRCSTPTASRSLITGAAGNSRPCSAGAHVNWQTHSARRSFF
jgi:hypothetical protein